MDGYKARALSLIHSGRECAQAQLAQVPYVSRHSLPP